MAEKRVPVTDDGLARQFDGNRPTFIRENLCDKTGPAITEVWRSLDRLTNARTRTSANWAILTDLDSRMRMLV